MAIDPSFVSLFHESKLQDPLLPSKPWESIISENGALRFREEVRSPEPVYDRATINEAILVRLVLNALQGVNSALDTLEKLCSGFCSDPADRSSHRLPSLWCRSSSTNALGRILSSIGHSGLVVSLLHKFVRYFLGANSNLDGEVANSYKQIDHESENRTCPPYSLVNQAFSVAVGKVLEGYVCALNTLFASVQLRRSLAVDVPASASSEAGCITSVVHSEITVLEVYLHTKELRTHIEALGNICLLKNVHSSCQKSTGQDSIARRDLEFHDFPRGADLLTYLYIQLRDADPARHSLLKFLFIRSCEPYCGLIKSWIYQASISDPYEEFIVEYMDKSSSYSHSEACFMNMSSFPSIKVRDGVSVPCFLKDVCPPLLRSGQQLQVLIKLLDLCSLTFTGNDGCSDETGPLFNLAILEDILPGWTASSIDLVSCSSPLTFSKQSIEAMSLKREARYRTMQEKLQKLFTRSNIRCRQINHRVILSSMVPVFLDNRKGCPSLPIQWVPDEGFISSPLVADNGPTILASSADDSDASSITEKFSSAEESSEEDSECSSSYSSEEQQVFAGPIEMRDILIVKEPKDLSAFRSSRVFSNEVVAQRPIGHEKPRPLECSLLFLPQKTCERTDSTTKCSGISKTLFADYYPGTCWPLGGLLKNPFSANGNYRECVVLHSSASSQNLTFKNTEVFKMEVPHYGKTNFSNGSELKLSRSWNQLENEEHEPASDAYIHQSSGLQKNYNFLNINPTLIKNAWWHTTGKKTTIPYFDFSSVLDPFQMYGEKLHSAPDHGFQLDLPEHVGSDVSTVKGGRECLDIQLCKGDEHQFGISADRGDQTTACFPVQLCKGDEHQLDVSVDGGDQTAACFPAHSSGSGKGNSEEGNALPSDSKGVQWESLLCHSDNVDRFTAGDHGSTSVATFEIPLEIIVDKCIVQEILLQYKYISDFTLKLLEEGFDLREHLLALRRYHFMELTDWADSFIISLCRHKWYVAEANQSISEIQGLLGLAVQRSSCEKDQYKERLFVYMKGQGLMPLSTTSIGIHGFDFIALGYRVEWPVSIILTPDALKIYALIFTFLVQVKMAVFALTDIWCTLKDLLHAISRSKDSGLGEREFNSFHVLLKLRQQLNHFIVTLQQYVQSQLLHKAWCKFLHNLKYQVKDLLDLESVHMAYLSDSLHICFLSTETQPVANMIDSILQCALDFQSCFFGWSWAARSESGDSSKLLSQINFSQVFAIRAKFVESLKGMHLCCLRSSRHGEFSLSRLWEYLNYNDYFSKILCKDSSL